MNALAIVGMACRFPDARSPMQLWENVLAQRRAFRRIPPERLRLEDYFSTDPHAPDCTYVTQAALLEGYEFDRVRFRVVGSTFRSADWAHWLALDVAAEALDDAGFPDGTGLDRERAGVLLGNTLTGEFSRAGLMRYRWPYVQRVLDAALETEGWAAEKRRAFLAALECQYKAPFPPVGDESLAGGLSNTIPGRICNQFDFKGGGYAVDGACASSLLALTTACSALTTGDLDVALAGGVDLSLDPFELVGFAKVGALAREEMRIYDARSTGFLPGEGCGVVVLMRYEDALAQGRRIYALIRGWGVSSDGQGGITRPEQAGQLVALRRAYGRTGFGIHSVEYFEGHGTGTTVGDLTELRALAQARRETALSERPAVVGSIKANIGHTKAAAGVAGLIKAAMAVHAQILPPTTGCEEPHAELTSERLNLRILREPELWPAEGPLRAGISAMGFGGINTHVVLEGVAGDRRRHLTARERVLRDSCQDAELFLLAAEDHAALSQQVNHLRLVAGQLSQAELGDLAAVLAKHVNPARCRAGLVAARPVELARGLETLDLWMIEGVQNRIDVGQGVFLGTGERQPQVGFLFPGQGSPAHPDGGILRRRFESVRELYGNDLLETDGDGMDTAVAQPAIVTASLGALRLLEQMGVRAAAGVGHSLGELTAWHWAGALDETTVLRVARARGLAMSDLGCPNGAMAGIVAGAEEVAALLEETEVCIAGLNSPRQTVISGPATAVAVVMGRAQARGFKAMRLAVSHAFHSSLVAGAGPVLARVLAQETFRPLQRPVISTITGQELSAEEDLPELLCRQLTSPVRFLEAVTRAQQMGIDLWIEAGPGRVLSGLAGDIVSTPVVSLDAGGSSLKGVLHTVAACFALGLPVRPAALFSERFVRPFHLDRPPRFLVNPCELAPIPGATASPAGAVRAETGPAQAASVHKAHTGRTPTGSTGQEQPTLDLVRQLVAKRTELPLDSVTARSSLLNDLHLNSISVGEIVAEAARCLGLAPPAAPTDYANATVEAVAQTLDELRRTGGATVARPDSVAPAGVDSWIRIFAVERRERHRSSAPLLTGHGGWNVFAPLNHPLRERLPQELGRLAGGGGVVVCMGCGPVEEQIDLLLAAAGALPDHQRDAMFVLVQSGEGAAGFARTLHLETGRPTCVITLPYGHPKAAEWIAAEVRITAGYSEAHYDASGTRREPRLRLVTLGGGPLTSPVGKGDVLLVTGGGKGIAAECALALGKAHGPALALLGRSRPEQDAELAAHLKRMEEAGVVCRYYAADVTDAEAVSAALRRAEQELGPITGLLHGAGRNEPRLLSQLDAEAFRQTLSPKLQGLRHVLQALNPERLRLLVSFGSIIARIGLRGEADYAVANEALTVLTEQFQRDHPQCRCLAVEWSVWSGVGMGQRLGRVDTLLQQGITPIPPEQGVAILLRLLQERSLPTAVVVSGRFGDPPTLRLEKGELPLWRFLERPRVYYPGVELVVDAVLSADTDLYLKDHVYQEDQLFPAVLGLEAMAQVAMALAESERPPRFDQVQLARPVVVPKEGRLTIRLAALVRPSGEVEVALRSETTGFQTDHFKARCRFGASTGGHWPKSEPETQTARVALEPATDLYGPLLFHTGRFQRVLHYRLLRAKQCQAQLRPDPEVAWFAHYLPQNLVLGDAGVRDAAIHAIQACIPQAQLLPCHVHQIVIGQLPCLSRTSSQPGRLPVLVLHAQERCRDGDTFHYDVELRGEDGSVFERWEGLQLRKVDPIPRRGPWPEALVGPYLERSLEDLWPGQGVKVVLEPTGPASRPGRSDHALQEALGTKLKIQRRPDGKPEVDRGTALSAAHTQGLTLAMAGPEPMGCDLESVVHRPPEMWKDLLGSERFRLAEMIEREGTGGLDAAATRVWTALECLKKAGATADAPLLLAGGREDGWVHLKSGPLHIATWIAPVRHQDGPVAFGLLCRRDYASV